MVPKGPAHVARLLSLIAEPSGVAPEARRPLEVLADSLRALEARIAALDAQIAERAKSDVEARRLMTIRPFRNLGAKSDAKKTHIFQLVTLTSARNILINMGIQLLGPGRLG